MTYPTIRVYVDLAADGLAAASTWTEITEWVCHDPIQIAYGRSPGVDDVQPGSGRLSLINIDGRFDPSDSTGAYYPNFRLRRRIKIEATLSATTYPLAYGWVDSVTQRWNHRAEQIAEVTWIDGLGALATHELPESVWDWQIAQRSNVVSWFRLGGGTSARVQDYSPVGAHGRWVTYENDDGPYGAAATPRQVIEAGITDPVIEQVDRPSQSFARMIAEADQPLGGVASGKNWRSSAIVCDQTTARLVDPAVDFTFETWLLLRPAYPLDSAGLKTGTAIDTCLIQWGDAIDSPTAVSSGNMVRLSFTADGELRVAFYDTSGTYLAGDVATGIAAGTPVHLVSARAGTGWSHYVNGVLLPTGHTMASAAIPWGFPAVLGYQTGRNPTAGTYQAGNWSTWGDVVLYDAQLTGTEAAENYVAGRWGRIDGTSGDLTVGAAIVQALEVAGWGLSTTGVDTGGHAVSPGAMRRRSVLDYVRELATSEGGLLWFTPAGELRFWLNDWTVTQPAATTVQWLLTDDDTTTGSSNEVGHTGDVLLTYSDDQLVNDCAVTWDGGTVRSENSTSIGAFGRNRRSVSTMLVGSDDATDRADWETWRRGIPRSDITTVSIEPADSTSWVAALSVELGDRVRVIVTRPDGSKVDEEHHVQSVRHGIDMGQGAFRTTLGLTPADYPSKPYRISLSLLDGDDALWF